jgi:hypothetical protein
MVLAPSWFCAVIYAKGFWWRKLPKMFFFYLNDEYKSNLITTSGRPLVSNALLII